MVDSVDPAPTDEATEAGRLAKQSDRVRAAEVAADPRSKVRGPREGGDARRPRARWRPPTPTSSRSSASSRWLLPFVVAFGHMGFDGVGLKGSISATTTRAMGGVSSARCARSPSSSSYNYRPLPKFGVDNVLSNVAAPPPWGWRSSRPPTGGHGLRRRAARGRPAPGLRVHALFVLLAVFSLYLFTQTGDGGMTPEGAPAATRVYQACGALSSPRSRWWSCPTSSTRPARGTRCSGWSRSASSPSASRGSSRATARRSGPTGSGPRCEQVVGGNLGKPSCSTGSSLSELRPERGSPG